MRRLYFGLKSRMKQRGACTLCFLFNRLSMAGASPLAGPCRALKSYGPGPRPCDVEMLEEKDLMVGSNQITPPI
jgi:hypothetical protein